MREIGTGPNACLLDNKYVSINSYATHFGSSENMSFSYCRFILRELAMWSEVHAPTVYSTDR